MTENTRFKAGELLHLRGQSLSRGEPVALPLVQSSMYHLLGQPDESPGYGRVTNPTWDHLEHVLAHMEQAPCLAFPSGMAAIAAALFATLKAGDRLLVPSDGYYVTRKLSERFLAQLGVSVEQRPTATFADGGFEGFAVVFLETPSNPGLDVIDLKEVSSAVRSSGGITIADNTTMTPLGQRPLDLGVDVVVASDTKSPGGHSDLLMEHMACRDESIMEAAREWRTFSGSIPSAHECWLLHRGLESFEVRFERMCATAGVVAERLQDHPAVRSVRYPGLPDDPAHALSARQMDRFGFLLSLTLESEGKAEAFINGCSLLRPATSFGGLHSSAERRARWGDAVDPAFVRLSVGCEPVEELWSALKQSLDNL